MGHGVRDHCPACSFSKLNLPQRMRAGGNGTGCYKAMQKLWRPCCRSVAGGAMIEVGPCRRLLVEHRPHSPAVRAWLHVVGPNGAWSIRLQASSHKGKACSHGRSDRSGSAGKDAWIAARRGEHSKRRSLGQMIHFSCGLGFWWELACKRSLCLWRRFACKRAPAETRDRRRWACAHFRPTKYSMNMDVSSSGHVCACFA